MSIYARIKELFGVGYRVTFLNKKINQLNERMERLESANDDLKILNARIYSKLLETSLSEKPEDYEFKVFSQFGDDGIIQFLIRRHGIDVKKFVEFGVENYREANTRFLLLNNNWKGLVMDGSEKNILQIRDESLYWTHNITAVTQFITAANINQIISENGFAGETGILHIDIDGNDYWIWKELQVTSPQLIIMEYNAVFGLNPWTVPYDESFYRTEKHHSNLYFGASLAALNKLADEKGYSLVGCNSAGNNAYFVRNDKLNGIKKRTLEEAYRASEFRESRDVNGKLTFVSEGERLKLIKGLSVYNVISGQLEKI